ncbi:hypothetical protein SO802_007194 [Lithocarpus litseifolius]|uniref:Uncharacterized protein n=1 Tax=Lithocarpus litseifolius TaxID=425828 RepID=A0AAW2DNT4_9ROSI
MLTDLEPLVNNNGSGEVIRDGSDKVRREKKDLNENGVGGCCGLILYGYAVNGRCTCPCHLWLIGCEGEMGSQLKRLPDAETVLEELDPKKIYIIGGLVDLEMYYHEESKRARNPNGEVPSRELDAKFLGIVGPNTCLFFLLEG